MSFPGRRLLHQWDLSVHRLSLEDLVRSCRETGLTGLAEVRLPGAVGLIFYYAGLEVNAHYREGAIAISGPTALDRLHAKVEGPVGTILVFELPLDMAHLLRGMTKRQPIEDQVRSAGDLEELLRRLQTAEHTGTLEIKNRKGAAMVLLVRGRASNFYWETTGGVTFEKGEARQKLEQALPARRGDGDLPRRLLPRRLEEPARGHGAACTADWSTAATRCPWSSSPARKRPCGSRS